MKDKEKYNEEEEEADFPFWERIGWQLTGVTTNWPKPAMIRSFKDESYWTFRSLFTKQASKCERDLVREWNENNMNLLSVLFRSVYSTSLALNAFEILYILVTKNPKSWNRNPQLFVLNLAFADLIFGLGGVGKWFKFVIASACKISCKPFLGAEDFK